MTELKPGGEAPMIAISLPSVEAWQLLHDCDGSGMEAPGPVWSVPDELAEQETT